MNPYLILFLLVGWLLSAGGAFVGGIKVESDHRDAQLVVAQQAAHDTYVKGVGEQRQIAYDTTQRLARQRVASENQVRDLKERISHAQGFIVKNLPGAAPGSAPEPAGTDVVLLGSFVGMWNDAVFAGYQPPAGAGGADGAGGRADPPQGAVLPLEPTLRASLENLADNAAYCNGLRVRVEAWQSWARKSGLAPP